MLLEQTIDLAVERIQQDCTLCPRIGVILGSGLEAFGDTLENVTRISLGSLEGFPVSTAPGHRGLLLFGTCAGVPVVVLQGRVHYYEGYSMEEVTMSTRLMSRLGIRTLILTNASGGIAPTLHPGDIMMLSDHISCFVPSPLRGPNEDSFGLRFPDMTEVYSKRLRTLAAEVAASIGLSLPEGVYVQLPGPSFETPAEIRMLKAMGADAVGMSTVCEAMVARHCGMEVAAFSFVTNYAAGLSGNPISVEDVNETSKSTGKKMVRLLTAMIPRLV